jgi:hypothetical protein
MLDRRASDRLRQRQSRERRRRGEVAYRVVFREHEVIEALIRSGRLTEAATVDRQQVELALGGVVRDWALRWKI